MQRARPSAPESPSKGWPPVWTGRVAVASSIAWAGGGIALAAWGIWLTATLEMHGPPVHFFVLGPLVLAIEAAAVWGIVLGVMLVRRRWPRAPDAALVTFFVYAALTSPIVIGLWANASPLLALTLFAVSAAPAAGLIGHRLARDPGPERPGEAP